MTSIYLVYKCKPNQAYLVFEYLVCILNSLKYFKADNDPAGLHLLRILKNGTLYFDQSPKVKSAVR